MGPTLNVTILEKHALICVLVSGKVLTTHILCLDFNTTPRVTYFHCIPGAVNEL